MAQNQIKLPVPSYDGKMSLEKTMKNRRSQRSFSRDALTLQEVSQLLWAAHGITDTVDMLRTAPSAGALFPLEIYLFAGNVKNLDAGVYRYIPVHHALEPFLKGDHRNDLSSAALNQTSVKQAPAGILMTSVWQRVTRKYGDRGKQYALLEAGHVGQNIMLQCVSLGLVSVPVGAFYDDQIKKLMNLNNGEDAVYLFPVGRKSAE